MVFLYMFPFKTSPSLNDWMYIVFFCQRQAWDFILLISWLSRLLPSIVAASPNIERYRSYRDRNKSTFVVSQKLTELPHSCSNRCWVFRTVFFSHHRHQEFIFEQVEITSIINCCRSFFVLGRDPWPPRQRRCHGESGFLQRWSIFEFYFFGSYYSNT